MAFLLIITFLYVSQRYDKPLRQNGLLYLCLIYYSYSILTYRPTSFVATQNLQYTAPYFLNHEQL